MFRLTPILSCINKHVQLSTPIPFHFIALRNYDNIIFPFYVGVKFLFLQGRGNKSSGDNFHAAPNIDHSQEFVRNDLKEWLCWMRSVIYSVILGDSFLPLLMLHCSLH